VILIPEVPYSVQSIADAIGRRVRGGSNFSIVAVAEGANSIEDAAAYGQAEARKKAASTDEEDATAAASLAAFEMAHAGNTIRLAGQLEALTGLETRVTILGYVQRGGTPSAADRLLSTRLGSAGADLISEGVFGVMVAARGEGTEPVPLEKVAGRRKPVPPSHPWVQAARHVGTCFGD
jgi:6-phosphofructokinase 1